MNSFRYPPRLLHTLVEPQWFKKPCEEKKSDLEEIEAEEAQTVEALRATILPEAPVPIGCSDAATVQESQPTVDLAAAASASSIRPFWEREEELQISFDDDDDLTLRRPSTFSRPSGISMDMSADSQTSCSIATLLSPTGRAG